jgi:uncharacterized delta-60 repeat protein
MNALAPLVLVLLLIAFPALGDSEVDLGFDPNANAPVYATALQPDGKIVLGGGFTSLGGVTRHYLARLNADGSLDPNFDPNVSGTVHCLYVQADGKILVGGLFIAVGGISRHFLARLNPNGTVDTSFQDPGLDSKVEALLVQPDGKIVAAGIFSSAGPPRRAGLARLNPDGTLDATFTPNATGQGGFASAVHTVVQQPDGKIVIGGDFIAIDSYPRNYVARLNADGSVDPDFDPNADNSVNSVTLQADGAILIGGTFATLSGVPRKGMARVNASGQLDPAFTFSPVYGPRNTSLQTDGRIILSGFGFAIPQGRVVRVETDGALDDSFAPVIDGYVFSPCLQPEGALVAGGGFFHFNGVPRNYIGRFTNGPATQSLTATSPSRVQWLRGGTSPETNEVTFELSTNGGSTWTALGRGSRIAGGWELTRLNLNTGSRVRARARIVSGEFNGSSGLIETVTTLDLLTQTPTLTAPASNTFIKGSLNVSFTLPETALPGSVTLTFDDGTPHLLSLANTQESAGNHSFSFTVTNPTASAQIATGTAIPDGVYTVNLSYRDAASNSPAAAGTVNVRIDTAAPTIGGTFAPLVASTGATGTVVLGNYTGQASTSDNFGVTGITQSPPAGSPLNAGTTTVTLTARDAAGNTASTTFDVTVNDGTAPTIAAPTGGFTPRAVTVTQGSTADLPDFHLLAVTADNVAVTVVDQSPAAGTTFGEGLVHVTLTAHDAAGNSASTGFDVRFRVVATTSLALKGDPIPNPGMDPRIPEGATWGVFGVPSITAQGTKAGWMATMVPGGLGIFSGPLFSPSLHLKVGDTATDANGATTAGVTFKSFREPVFAGDGFAVLATVAGASKASDTGLWESDGATLREVAREGVAAVGGDGAKFKAFISYAMPAPEVVFFTAKLGSPAATDMGLWAWTKASGLHFALREGQKISVEGSMVAIKSFQALTSVNGSPGQGRYDAPQATLDVLLTLEGKRTAQASVAADGTVSLGRISGQSTSGGQYKLGALGVPSSIGGGDGAAALTGLVGGTSAVGPLNNFGIIDTTSGSVQAQKGKLAASPGIFKTFSDPVAGHDSAGKRALAFTAKLGGVPASGDSGIWSFVNGLLPVAREGTEPQGAGGTKWKSFTSLSMQEGRGPLFTATLASGTTKVKATNDAGLWATDLTGALRLIFREGDEVVTGHTLQRFDVLGSVAASPGQRRAWTSGDVSGRVIYRAFYKGGSSGIVCTTVP